LSGTARARDSLRILESEFPIAKPFLESLLTEKITILDVIAEKNITKIFVLLHILFCKKVYYLSFLKENKDRFSK